MNKRGYFGIGIYHPKTTENVGTLWRSAFIFGASFIFTIGRRYKKQASDTPDTIKHVPLYDYVSYDDFYSHIPRGCRLIFIEMHEKALPITNFYHYEQAIYILGAEDYGIPERFFKNESTIYIPTVKTFSMNVAVAGSIVMYDRFLKSLV